MPISAVKTAWLIYTSFFFQATKFQKDEKYEDYLVYLQQKNRFVKLHSKV